MQSDGIFRRRQLPHWDVEGKPVFITACLDGSISARGLKKILQYRDEIDALSPAKLTKDEWEHKKGKLVFQFVDQLLDHRAPIQDLKDPQQAQIVQDAFLHFAGERYSLLAFVVMPSHHHWLFLPDESWSQTAVAESIAKGKRRSPREMISHSIQSYTATMCNRARGTSGSYWQTETFDHWVRNDSEMIRVIDYIENNPVKAGMVERPEDWPWSSAIIRIETSLQPGDPIVK